MTTIRTAGLIDEYARAMGLQTLSREIELNSEDVERRLVEVRRQHPEDTPEQQYARAVARELWFNYPRLRRSAPAELPQVPPPPPEVQAVTLRLTMWQKLLLYLWMAVALGLLGVIAARGQGGQGPMIEALDEGIRVRFFAAGVFRWNCIGANIACTWNAGTRRIDLTIAGGGAAHNLLSATHTDTVAAAPVRGDLIVGSAVPDWQRFARGTQRQLVAMPETALDPTWENGLPLDYTVAQFLDDFPSGGASGAIGTLGWATGNIGAAAVWTYQHPGLPHIGVLRGTTTAVAGQGACLYLGGTSGAGRSLGNLGQNAGWESFYIFNLNLTAGVTTFSRLRIGFADSNVIAEPNNGIWLRYDTNVAYADAGFHVVCRAAGANTEPAGPPVYAVDNLWHRLRIRSLVNGQVLFQFDANPEVTVAAGCPNVDLYPVVIMVTDTAATRDIHTDYFSFKMTGLVR